MIRKKSVGEHIFDISNVVFLGIITIIAIYPFWYVLVKSLLDYSHIIKTNIYIIPTKITFEAYKYVFSSELLLNSLFISVIVTIVGCLFQLLITAMSAYSLTRKKLPGRKIIFIFIIITMFFSGGLIPYYLLIKSLRLIDNLLVLIIPGCINTFNLIIMRTFFSELPAELEESARIDGASYAKIFFKIILPLSGPVSATIGLFIAVGLWNNWFSPMIFLNSKKLWPLALTLRDIIINDNTELSMKGVRTSKDILLSEPKKMAVIIVSIIPIILVYPFIQKHFVKGVMIGAIKG